MNVSAQIRNAQPKSGSARRGNSSRPNKPQKGPSRRPRGLSQNPAVRSFPDNSLALTRAQFTATSPQNYWEFVPASSPAGLRIRAREMVGAVTATAALTGSFALLNTGAFQGFPLNPSSFARLGQLAQAYEYFKFHKADVCFQSNQPTTAVGEILLCAEYDSSDPAPSTSIGMMRNVSATMANIYSDASYQCLASLSRLPKFIVSGGSTAPIDQTSQATLYVAAEGVTAASGAGLGYVCIEYDVEFYTPQ